MATNLVWGLGTAYDFYISLIVLHKPNKFGLRGAWAKGVRARLPEAERQFLEQTYGFYMSPLPWIYSLPAPKDGAAALEALAAIPTAERLRTLTITHEVPPEMLEMLQNVAARG